MKYYYEFDAQTLNYIMQVLMQRPYAEVANLLALLEEGRINQSPSLEDVKVVE